MGWLLRFFGLEYRGNVWVVAGDGDFDCEVVGDKHHQSALDLIAGGRAEDGYHLDVVADLVPDPNHPDDPFAVMVMINGLQVGHLSSPRAKVIGQVLNKHRFVSAQVDAIVVGGWNRRGGHYVVKLDLPI